MKPREKSPKLVPTFSICPTHGYLQGEQKICSSCGSQTEVYSRIVGYLRPVRQWNDGKRAEYDNRKLYRVMPENQIPPEPYPETNDTNQSATAVNRTEKKVLANYEYQDTELRNHA